MLVHTVIDYQTTLYSRGVVFLPMWQREALWISFGAVGSQEYALRIFVDRINAVSGLRMDDRADEAQATEVLQDYVVVPGQQWLDGICISSGIVRQFVAMPLGSGYTVEGQKTGEEKYGGLQIEIIPSYKRHLRTFLPGSTKQFTAYELHDPSKKLNENKTPLELGLSAGDKIRSYPPRPTYWAAYAISDLTGDASKEDTHINVVRSVIENYLC
ncbi:hypothetical protein GJ744_003832 [Endocarpon pusillum]|uniref:Uncharacterized protein n=1 Tax=Endocarpon pusillum TaxID=364733 RepID=A0A8H7AQG8_9EURO|nr:hypothetical protein GJ744_003832 [Endocarpon pusillum]